MSKKKILCLLLGLTLSLCACSDTPAGSIDNTSLATATTEELTEAAVGADKEEVSDTENSASLSEEAAKEIKIELSKSYKTRGNTNPIITQEFGADPFALVYGDRVYIYMTADKFEYDGNGNIKENSYSTIRSIHVVSTKDMKNFEDHGLIPVAGASGIAKWANNSWAPSVACKNIDGKDKFFLYFADNGGGIGVLEADSPTGPFVDPLGKALISRSTPNCSNVLWLFDPAVLVDDDGSGYLYFGGGVPNGKSSDPGTARVVKLGQDMISIDGDPVKIDVPYLFEDSGIHKANGKYYYTYCTNWDVDSSGKSTYGFTSGQIACLESDSPMGPFVYKERILDNPGSLCGLYGNNHHAIFNFKDQWYIVYHSRLLEKNMGVENGYRATFINAFDYKEDGSIGLITQKKEGPDQLQLIDPYEVNMATCVSNMAGTNAVSQDGSKYGNMLLGEIETGDYVEITGVDFKDSKPSQLVVRAKVPQGCGGKIHVRLNFPNKEDVALLELKEESDDIIEFSCQISEKISGENYLYFVFEGQGYEIESWQFIPEK